MPIPLDIIYYTGRCLKIIWAKKRNGTYPAKKFFDSIKPPDWGKLDRIIKRLADYGKVINIEQFRKIDGQLYEVKGGNKRLVGFFIPEHFVLTHGFKKRGGGRSANKFPKPQMEKAIQIKEDFESTYLRGGKGGQNGS